MARIILIHGAWGNAASWLRLIPFLHRHDVEAIDLPGHGASPVPPETVGMADYVAHVEKVLRAGPPAFIVGHSMGGIVTAQVAARNPDHVLGTVYVAAVLPRDGDSLLSLIGQQDTPGVSKAVRHGPVKGTTVLDADLAPPMLFQDASAQDQQDAMAAMSPQSNRAQSDPAQIGPDFDRVPRAYVFCTQDQTVTYPLQQQMVAASPCDPTLTLDCGHVPQLTQPKELADFLNSLDHP
ncbi:alpha/beta fold hydrolase [Aliiroseovarius sp. PTFE2010]|uniref:alpha/beta fold hydrolase n=1 Tax=Aliiroseovarius sp. PTFE2010 TaxID=3417190 RepID=UPI003CF731A1